MVMSTATFGVMRMFDFLRGERDAGDLRGHKKQLKKGRCLNSKKSTAFHIDVDRKYLLLREEREAGYLREHKKN